MVGQTTSAVHGSFKFVQPTRCLHGLFRHMNRCSIVTISKLKGICSFSSWDLSKRQGTKKNSVPVRSAIYRGSAFSNASFLPLFAPTFDALGEDISLSQSAFSLNVFCRILSAVPMPSENDEEGRPGGSSEHSASWASRTPPHVARELLDCLNSNIGLRFALGCESLKLFRSYDPESVLKGRQPSSLLSLLLASTLLERWPSQMLDTRAKNCTHSKAASHELRFLEFFANAPDKRLSYNDKASSEASWCRCRILVLESPTNMKKILRSIDFALSQKMATDVLFWLLESAVFSSTNQSKNSGTEQFVHEPDPVAVYFLSAAWIKHWKNVRSNNAAVQGKKSDIISKGSSSSTCMKELEMRLCPLDDHQEELLRCVTQLLQVASHDLVASIIFSLQENVAVGEEKKEKKPKAPFWCVRETRNQSISLLAPIGVEWNSFVSPELAQKCFQRVLAAVKAVKHSPALPRLPVIAQSTNAQGGSWMPTDVSLLSLHQSVVCAFPSGCTDVRKSSLGVLSLSCLRFARLKDLTSLLCYLVNECPDARAAFYSKFLANSGSSVFSTRMPTCGGVKNFAPLFYEALNVLADLKSIKEVEEGVVHGCAVLNAIGGAASVREVYTKAPTLRETAHSVAACVVLGDISGALSALSSLGDSQMNGWVYLPDVVVEVMRSVSQLVGRRGSKEHIAELYRALVRFRNRGMLMTNYIEVLLGGLGDRIMEWRESEGKAEGTRYPSTASVSSREVKSGHPLRSPHDETKEIIDMVSEALRFIGDDVNGDVVLSLIESSLRCGNHAVSLTVGIMKALREASVEHIALSTFFSPGDASTADLPFLHYFAVCSARDSGLLEVLEHLASIWGANVEPIRFRAKHLAPAYRLWRCASCGRPNSDRFNYCACSALRYTFIECPSCRYAQDERWPTCLRCGTICGGKGSIPSLASAIVRKTWLCGFCRAANPSRHVLLCFRCRKLAGPLADLRKNLKTSNSRLLSKSFCGCHYGIGFTYTSSIGYCRACHEYAESHSRKESFFWCCISCNQLRSSLERSCPRCPHIEFAPFLFSHRTGDKRVCRRCGAVVEDCIENVCPDCGHQSFSLQRIVSAEKLRERKLPEAQSSPLTRLASAAHRCEACQGESTSFSLLCRHCLHRLPLEFEFVSTKEEENAFSLKIMEETICSVEHAVLHWADEDSNLASDQPPSSHFIAFDAKSVESVLKGAKKAFADLLPPLQVERSDEWSTYLSSLGNRYVDLLHFLAPKMTQKAIYRRLGAIVLSNLKTVCSQAGEDLKTPLVCVLEEIQERIGGRHACPLCLASHPKELCAFNFAEHSWLCNGCGQLNDSSFPNVIRYCCETCLDLRPSVRALQPSLCWMCKHCSQTNLEIENFCIYCGVGRGNLRIAPSSLALREHFHHLKSHFLGSFDETVEVICEESCTPFFPTRCVICHCIYLESSCPTCSTKENKSKLNCTSGLRDSSDQGDPLVDDVKKEVTLSLKTSSIPTNFCDQPFISNSSASSNLRKPHRAIVCNGEARTKTAP